MKGSKNKIYLFHDGGSNHIETSPLTCRANQLTGFYIVGTSVMKQLNQKMEPIAKIQNIKPGY